MLQQPDVKLERGMVRQLDALMFTVGADGKDFEPWEELADALLACHHPLDVAVTAVTASGTTREPTDQLALMSTVNSAIAHIGQVASLMRKLDPTQGSTATSIGPPSTRALPSWWDELQTWIGTTTTGLQQTREVIY